MLRLIFNIYVIPPSNIHKSPHTDIDLVAAWQGVQNVAGCSFPGTASGAQIGVA
jgi:hypothetical protein